MEFELPFVALLREIQIGCINYWQSENDVSVEPLCVVVQAGLSKENLTNVITLEQVKDTAFWSVGSQVYGKTMFDLGSEEVDQDSSLESLIQRKMDKLCNFKAKFIQFRVRRGNPVCMENSLLSNKIGKPQFFGIHYISLTGYDCSKTSGSLQKVVLREQKKTATEIMAMICAGDFSHSLQVIANQLETTNKIKEHFPNLVALVEIKTGLIEPIFSALATHNAAMGDWLIREFIRRNLFTHSALVGKLVLCDRARLIDRIRIMLDKTVEMLANAAENQGVFTQTLL